MYGVGKMFGVVCVLNGVLLLLCVGEVYGLMGENGVGKLMLIKIFIGFY